MRTFVLIATLLAATASAAQGAPPEEASNTRYHRTTVIDLSAVDVEGRRKSPATSYILTKKKTHFRNLIEMRGHFRSEMMSSVGEL